MAQLAVVEPDLVLRPRPARVGLQQVDLHPLVDERRQGEADRRAFGPVIVLAAVKVWVAEDGVAADDVEGEGLARQPGGGCQGHHTAQAVRVTRSPG